MSRKKRTCWPPRAVAALVACWRLEGAGSLCSQGCLAFCSQAWHTHTDTSRDAIILLPKCAASVNLPVQHLSLQHCGTAVQLLIVSS
jgi:hypothetical protein